MADQHAALRLIALAELKKAVAAADKDARKETGLERGDRKTVRHPLDSAVKLGTVTLTDPKPAAKVVDENEFGAWMQQHYPENCRATTRITGPEKEVIAVLRRHAPHLISTVTEVQDYATSEVLRLSEKAGEPAGPGGELDVPGVAVTESTPTLQVRNTADAAAAIRELWQAGAIDLDGTVRALPSTTTA